MSGWCYRIIKHDRLEDEPDAKKHNVKDIVYEICEVFHQDGKILCFSGVDTHRETVKYLKDAYNDMAEAFKHPVIEYRNGNYYEGKTKLKKAKFPTCKGARRRKL